MGSIFRSDLVQKSIDDQSCVITDTNILINFTKINRMDIFQKLHLYAFYIPEEVYVEITYPAQRLVLDQALGAGWLRKAEIADLNELRSYKRYTQKMGDGEAACLAIATCRKWIMACDEEKNKLISREIQHELGTGYLLNTPGILLKAIREGILTVSQADAIKCALAQNRFVMSFASFQDLI